MRASGGGGHRASGGEMSVAGLGRCARRCRGSGQRRRRRKSRHARSAVNLLHRAGVSRCTVYQRTARHHGHSNFTAGRRYRGGGAPDGPRDERYFYREPGHRPRSGGGATIA